MNFDKKASVIKEDLMVDEERMTLIEKTTKTVYSTNNRLGQNCRYCGGNLEMSRDGLYACRSCGIEPSLQFSRPLTWTSERSVNERRELNERSLQDQCQESQSY